jgi:transcriptional regulator with XRE-family HTH domain
MSEQPDQELAAFGKTIREIREAQAMTPAELAAAANIEREDLEALEAGRLTPADDLLHALSAALCTDAAALGGYWDTAAVLAAFGRRLRELRMKSGLTQEALGRRAGGMNRVSVYSLESGSADPRLTTIRRLARGLGVPPRALIERRRAKRHARRLIGHPI